MITLTAKITLADGTEIVIDKRNMVSIEQSIIDRSDINLPSAGIISNGGSIEFVDYDGRIKKLAESYKLNDKAKATIFINDTLSKINSQIGEYYATNWDYESNNRVVKTSLTDDLTEWQNIEIKKWDLHPIETTGWDIYDHLVSLTPSKWVFENLDNYTATILDDYILERFYLNAGNLWNQWQKLCVACGLYIFKNKNGKIVVSYDFRS